VVALHNAVPVRRARLLPANGDVADAASWAAGEGPHTIAWHPIGLYCVAEGPRTSSAAVEKLPWSGARTRAFCGERAVACRATLGAASDPA
jgi:hypothetical protein